MFRLSLKSHRQVGIPLRLCKVQIGRTHHSDSREVVLEVMAKIFKMSNKSLLGAPMMFLINDEKKY